MEELYIRNLVSVSSNELTFNLPFDLHGFDCGAPDCYSTDLSFSFPHNNELEFPNELSFTIHEHGCKEPEFRKEGTYKLVEQEKNYVNYYSTEHKSNLVIIGDDERFEYIYYFTDVKPDSIKANAVNELISNFSEDDADASAPYRSTTMTSKEYERFIKN